MIQASSRSFPLITTVFDSEKDHPHSLLHSGSIHSTLMRLLPPDFSFSGREWEESEEEFLGELHRILPIFKWIEWKESSRYEARFSSKSYCISLFLVNLHRRNAAKFFYEMISRWLLPGKRLNISSFFATDFRFPELTDELFTISEMVISFEALHELELVRCYLPILESEIKLGLISVYHAHRILEIKGLSSDEKTSLIQERIASLLEKRPKDFDYDIFSQMQHFLVMCGEEFKAVRSYGHMSRIIYIFYFFHKMLKEQSEKSPEHRHVLVKLSKTHLHLPLGMKKVLGVFVGLNFLNDNEMFEERHLIRVLKTLVTECEPVEESYFSSAFKEAKIQLLYIEIERRDAGNFSLEDMRTLRMSLQDGVRNGVEKWMRPVFMPRNEEEVMRNIITLSQQLRYPKDLPQVIISFDAQTEFELSFTLILLRILSGGELSVQELFEKANTSLKFIPDRVKRIGVIRRKYIKEATVFRVVVSALDFIRPDHSVDLFRARQEIISELQRIVGEVRDYNGGMIAKQYEQFSALRALFPAMEKREDLLLENVFHSIFPVELRSVLEPALIKIFFTMLLELIEGKKIGHICKKEEEAAFIVFSYQDVFVKQKIHTAVSELHLPSSQLITISLPVSDSFYFGYIFWEEEKELQDKFLNTLERVLDF